MTTPTVNDFIRDDPASWPAVRELNFDHLDHAARAAALALADHGYWNGVLQPDDGTRYDVLIARTSHPSVQYVFSSSFGPLCPWRGRPTIHPDYACEHYVTDRNTWTGTVYALFLNMVAEHLAAPQ